MFSKPRLSLTNLNLVTYLTPKRLGAWESQFIGMLPGGMGHEGEVLCVLSSVSSKDSPKAYRV